MDINMEFPKRENFQVPDGIWTGQLKEVFVLDEPYKDQTDKTVRLKFRIPELEDEVYEYVVAKNYAYSLALHSELRKHLESWVGAARLPTLVTDGKLTMNKLIDQFATLHTVGIPNSNYDHPFVLLKKILPARLKKAA